MRKIQVIETFMSSDGKMGYIHCPFFEDAEIRSKLRSDCETFEWFSVERPSCAFYEMEPHFRSIFVKNPKNIKGIKYVQFFD